MIVGYWYLQLHYISVFAVGIFFFFHIVSLQGAILSSILILFLLCFSLGRKGIFSISNRRNLRKKTFFLEREENMSTESVCLFVMASLINTK